MRLFWLSAALLSDAIYVSSFFRSFAEFSRSDVSLAISASFCFTSTFGFRRGESSNYNSNSSKLFVSWSFDLGVSYPSSCSSLMSVSFGESLLLLFFIIILGNGLVCSTIFLSLICDAPRNISLSSYPTYALVAFLAFSSSSFIFNCSFSDFALSLASVSFSSFI